MIGACGRDGVGDVGAGDCWTKAMGLYAVYAVYVTRYFMIQPKVEYITRGV